MVKIFRLSGTIRGTFFRLVEMQTLITFRAQCWDCTSVTHMRLFCETLIKLQSSRWKEHQVKSLKSVVRRKF